MFVKICGHVVDWKKTIKPYALLKLCLCGFVLTVSAPVLSYADDASELSVIAPSSGIPMPCNIDVHKTTNHKKQNIQPVTSQTMSPAYALALALGVRSIAGPMERSSVRGSKKEFATSSSSFDRRTPLTPYDKGNTPVIFIQTRLPRPGMEQ
jgi:hypothetical protein